MPGGFRFRFRQGQSILLVVESSSNGDLAVTPVRPGDQLIVGPSLDTLEYSPDNQNWSDWPSQQFGKARRFLSVILQFGAPGSQPLYARFSIQGQFRFKVQGTASVYSAEFGVPPGP